jgi:hypothetical protein
MSSSTASAFSINLTKASSSLKFIQGTNGIGIGILDLDYEVPKYQATVKQPNYKFPIPEIGWEVPPFGQLNVIVNKSASDNIRSLITAETVPVNQPFHLQMFDFFTRKREGHVPPQSNTNNFGSRLITDYQNYLVNSVLPEDNQLTVMFITSKPPIDAKDDEMWFSRECWINPFKEFVQTTGIARLKTVGLYMSNELLDEWTKYIPTFKEYFLFIRTYTSPQCPYTMFIKDFYGKCSPPVDIQVTLQVTANTELVKYDLLPYINGKHPTKKIEPRTWNSQTGVMSHFEAVFVSSGMASVCFFVKDTLEEPFTGVTIRAEINHTSGAPCEPIEVIYDNPMQLANPNLLINMLWYPTKWKQVLTSISFDEIEKRKSAFHEFAASNPVFKELYDMFKNDECPTMSIMSYDKHDIPIVQHLLTLVKNATSDWYDLVRETILYNIRMSQQEAMKVRNMKEEEIRKADRAAAIAAGEEYDDECPPPPSSLPLMMTPVATSFSSAPRPAPRPQFAHAPQLMPAPSFPERHSSCPAKHTLTFNGPSFSGQ